MAKSLLREEKLCTDYLNNSKNPKRLQMDDDRIISMIKIKNLKTFNKSRTLLRRQEYHCQSLKSKKVKTTKKKSPTFMSQCLGHQKSNKFTTRGWLS